MARSSWETCGLRLQLLNRPFSTSARVIVRVIVIRQRVGAAPTPALPAPATLRVVLLYYFSPGARVGGSASATLAEQVLDMLRGAWERQDADEEGCQPSQCIWAV